MIQYVKFRIHKSVRCWTNHAKTMREWYQITECNSLNLPLREKKAFKERRRRFTRAYLELRVVSKKVLKDQSNRSNKSSSKESNTMTKCSKPSKSTMRGWRSKKSRNFLKRSRSLSTSRRRESESDLLIESSRKVRDSTFWRSSQRSVKTTAVSRVFTWNGNSSSLLRSTSLIRRMILSNRKRSRTFWSRRKSGSLNVRSKFSRLNSRGSFYCSKNRRSWRNILTLIQRGKIFRNRWRFFMISIDLYPQSWRGNLMQELLRILWLI